jgi:transposase
MRVLLQTPLNVTALAKRFGVARTTIQRLKKDWRECSASDAPHF